MTQSGLLDHDDLRQLTGAARTNAQETWLKAEGIPYRREGSRIIVAWLHVHGWLEGRPVSQSVAPDFS